MFTAASGRDVASGSKGSNAVDLDTLLHGILFVVLIVAALVLAEKLDSEED